MICQPEMPSLMTTSEMEESGRKSREVERGIRRGGAEEKGRVKMRPRVVASCRPSPRMARIDSGEGTNEVSESAGDDYRWRNWIRRVKRSC